MDLPFKLLDPHLFDPKYGGPIPFWPARHRSHTWRHDKKKQIVWPRDKKQKGAHDSSRWKDVLTGKGPDMWISGRDSDGPHRPVWTGWQSPPWPRHGQRWDNLGYNYRRDDEMVPLPWARRPRWERYDFKERRYRMPRAGTWSDVKWNNDARFELYYRDRFGNEVINTEFDDGLSDTWWSENPFRYNHHSPIWDWHRDKWVWPADQLLPWE